MRLLSALKDLGLDRFFYRIWRLNPAALYRRYAHHAFDRRYGVMTRGYGDLRYEPTPAPVLEKALAALDAEPSELVFIDIGSGKGKVVLLASTHPFKKVVGVELYEDFHDIAVENVARFPAASRRAGAIELLRIDAALYRFPPEPSVVYLFNPFAEEILEKVLGNLEASLAEHPRELYVVFYAPIVRRGTPWDRRRIVDRSPALEVLRAERDFTIYRSRRRDRF